jgi:hypothetical protein
MLPDIMLGAFYTLFWVLIILGMALLIFLAITGTGDESMFWFGLAAGLLVVGVLSFLNHDFVAILVILIIAGIAIYNGFNDITLALMHPKTKYILIPAMIIAGFVVLGALFYYFPGFGKNLYLSIVGTFALVFGLFSIMLGFYKPDEVGDDDSSSQKTAYTGNKARMKK